MVKNGHVWDWFRRVEVHAPLQAALSWHLTVSFCDSASRPRRLTALALGCSRSGSASSMEAGSEIWLRLGFRVRGFRFYALGIRTQF